MEQEKQHEAWFIQGATLLLCLRTFVGHHLGNYLIDVNKVALTLLTESLRAVRLPLIPFECWVRHYRT